MHYIKLYIKLLKKKIWENAKCFRFHLYFVDIGNSGALIAKTSLYFDDRCRILIYLILIYLFNLIIIIIIRFIKISIIIKRKLTGC